MEGRERSGPRKAALRSEEWPGREEIQDLGDLIPEEPALG